MVVVVVLVAIVVAINFCVHVDKDKEKEKIKMKSGIKGPCDRNMDLPLRFLNFFFSHFAYKSPSQSSIPHVVPHEK
jgi:hypothetical protein